MMRRRSLCVRCRPYQNRARCVHRSLTLPLFRLRLISLCVLGCVRQPLVLASAGAITNPALMQAALARTAAGKGDKVTRR